MIYYPTVNTTLCGGGVGWLSNKNILLQLCVPPAVKTRVTQGHDCELETVEWPGGKPLRGHDL